MIVRDQRNRFAIGGDITQGVECVGVINHRENSAGLEGGKDAHDQLGAVHQVEQDAVAIPDAVLYECVRQPVGHRVNLGVCQPLVFADQRNLVRAFRHIVTQDVLKKANRFCLQSHDLPHPVFISD